MTVRTVWLTSPGQTREDTRRAPVGTFTPIDEVQTRYGVIPGGDPVALTGTGPMTATIGVGRIVIQGTSAQGAYGFVITEPETVEFADGDPLLPRIDSVFAVVYDSLYDSSGIVEARIEVVQGTPAATPERPAEPVPSAMRLYDVTIPAGASAGSGGINWATAVDDRRRYTVAVGGITPTGPTGAPAGAAYEGQWRDNRGRLQRWDGDAWVDQVPVQGETWENDLLLGQSRRVKFGSDVELYRSAANTLYTPDSLAVGGGISVQGVGGTLYAVKTSDQTRQSTTLAEDPELWVMLSPNATYLMTGYLVYSNSQDGSNFNIDWTVPAGASGSWAPFAQHTDSPALGGSIIRTVVSNVDAARSVGAISSDPLAAAIRGTVKTGASGGKYGLQWARFSGTGIATLYRHSWIKLERVA